MTDVNRKFARLVLAVSKAVQGHMLNPFWWSRQKRRDRRCEVFGSLIPEYFRKYYLDAALAVPYTEPVASEGPEKVFVLWLQGEESAPLLIRRCIASIRKHCPGCELIVLDDKSLKEYTDIPDYIWQKFKEGKMTMAQFSDICRLDLLYRYGGYWIDSTCFMISDLPDYVTGSDFFVYMAGHRISGYYSFIQSCFLRARKGSYLVAAWRAMMWEFWRVENSKVDYFQLHLMFKCIVENIPSATAEFARMPKIDQDPTHEMWFENGNNPFDSENLKCLSSQVCFQKTTYRITECLPGSNRDYILNGNEKD